MQAYALVNATRGHAINWVASERHKQGYVPEGHDIVVAQMAAAWSGPRPGAADRDVARDAWSEAARLLRRTDEPRWTDVVRWTGVVRWPHALPDVLVARDALEAGEDAGLLVATDGAAGGRAYLALDEGLAAGARLAASLARP